MLIAVGELPTLIMRSQKGRHTVNAPRWVATIGTVAAVGVFALCGPRHLAERRRADRRERWPGRGVITGTSRAWCGDAGGVRLTAAFRPDHAFMPQVSVGRYRAAVHAFGSPGDSYTNILGEGAGLRSTLDEMLLRGWPMEISSTAGPSHVESANGGCVRSLLSPDSPTLTFNLPEQGVLVTAPQRAGLALRVKLFSASFPNQAMEVIPSGSTILLKWSQRTTTLHWKVQMTAVPRSAPVGSVATVCPIVAATSRPKPWPVCTNP